MVLGVTGSRHRHWNLARGELGEALCAMRLCPPAGAAGECRLSCRALGAADGVQAYRVGRVEVFDGSSGCGPPASWSWPHAGDVTARCGGSQGAAVCCNGSTGWASSKRRGWCARSTGEDGFSQPQIAMPVDTAQSWVCRRLALAESLSEELTASVRLDWCRRRRAVELARCRACNQDAVTQVLPNED